MTNPAPDLAIVVPCFDEEQALPQTGPAIAAFIGRLRDAGKVGQRSRVWFVDDGSGDRTWAIIGGFVAAGMPAAGVKLSRNRGHQNALLAGLLLAEGDAVVTIDADLQDDLDAVERMVDRYRDGVDVVYGVRNVRASDSALKRVTASAFYALAAALGAPTVAHHADCRLLSRRAVEALRGFREANLFLRGIVPLIGFRSEVVEYERHPRTAGTTKYSLRRMVSLAAAGITSFSVVPLRIISAAGLAVFAGAMAATIWALWISLFTDRSVPGWASVVLPMYFLGGVQLLALGVMGEYLGRIYVEVKGRPRYIVEDVIGAANVTPATAVDAAAR
ncbi:MAG: glycosyltransferase [Burkholderiales bacterium]